MSLCESAVACVLARKNRVHHSPNSDEAVETDDAPVSCTERAIFSLSFNWQRVVVKHKLWWTRVDVHIICGALPMRRHVKELVSKENVFAVVTMNRGFELRDRRCLTRVCDRPASADDWKAANVEHLWLPTPDFVPPNLPNLKRAVEWMRGHIEARRAAPLAGDDENPPPADEADPLVAAESTSAAASAATRPATIYVHCKAGRGRSAAVVICYLMR